MFHRALSNFQKRGRLTRSRGQYSLLIRGTLYYVDHEFESQLYRFYLWVLPNFSVELAANFKRY